MSGSESSDSSSSSEYDFLQPRRGRPSPPPPLLSVPKELFSENNRLLEGLNEETKRLRAENQGLNMTVESLTEENVLLVEKLAAFGERVSLLQIKFSEILEANQELLSERNSLKIQVDTLSLRLAESESALQAQQEQYQAGLNRMTEEISIRELTSRLDIERLQKQMASLGMYTNRLENECGAQHTCRVREVNVSRQALQQLAKLTKELDATRKLLAIEERKNITNRNQG